MLVELSIAWVIGLNVGAWLVIQLGLAWVFLRLPTRWFVLGPGRGGSGRFYERVLGVRLWKDRLPDAAGWFGGGFTKRSLAGTDAEYLEQYVREAWRGELCHWAALAFVPVFGIWNPVWGVAVNAGVALAVNLPCIVALRYNRMRFQRLRARVVSGI